jgi:hypothetical protein
VTTRKELTVLCGIVMGMASFCLFIALHWALIHWRVIKAEFRNLILLCGLCVLASWLGCAIVAGQAVDPRIIGHPFVSAATSLLVFACCWVSYMPFYYSIATSLSVQTVILVRQAGMAGCSMAFLESLFASKTVLEKRLQILVDNGYLNKDGDRFRATPKGQRISRVFSYLKRIWRLGAGG